MSYLLDKKLKRRKLSYIMLGIVILMFITYFRVEVFYGLSYVSSAIFHPVLVLGNNIHQGFSNAKYFFSSKKSLYLENESLKLQISESQADRSNYISVVDENNKLKEILNRKKEKEDLLLSAILSKSNNSVYNTLVIDVGLNQGVTVNQKVLALGNIPIGKISDVYANSSKVVLYSNPGEKTEVVISGKDTFMSLVGRGGGNFEIILPKDFSLETGTEVVLPSINSHVVATVVKTISDPRDSFIKAILVSPINIQSVKFVEIEK